MNYVTSQSAIIPFESESREIYLSQKRKVKDFLCLMTPILQCMPSCSMMIRL